MQDAKTKVKIDRSHRLGKKRDANTKPTPIVVKFNYHQDKQLRWPTSAAHNDTLLASALKKRGAYKMVYPDGQSTQTIPGSLERFTLVKYKQGLGKSYGRLTLYLSSNFPMSND